jgi:histidyl-tRNA synthetase
VENDSPSRGSGKSLKSADRRGLRRVALLGEDERAAGTVTLRDLVSGEQESVPAADLATRLSAPASRHEARGTGGLDTGSLDTGSLDIGEETE